MTIWYRTGSVNVNAGTKVVTGVDTLWAYAKILDEGDIFTVDGARMYEIASIDSDTQLTLVENYAGVTASNQSYSIIPNYAVRPYAPIVGRQMLLINKWLIREQELTDWQTKPASSNPATPTKVRLTAWDGTTGEYLSLPQLLEDAMGAADWNKLVNIPANINSWALLDPATYQPAPSGVRSINTKDGDLTLSLSSEQAIQGGYSPTLSDSTVGLSNGNLTATFANNAASRLAVIDPAHGGGLRYLEVTFTSGATDADCAIGVVGDAPDKMHQIGYDGAANEVGMFQNTGRIYANNVRDGDGAAFDVAGAVVGVAVNAAARRVWFRVNGGIWNNNASANPVTGVGGVAIQGTGPIRAAVCTSNIAAFTFNPAATLAGATPWGAYTPANRVTPTDIAISSPLNGQMLRYLNGMWVNSASDVDGYLPTWRLIDPGTMASKDYVNVGIASAVANKADLVTGNLQSFVAKTSALSVTSRDNTFIGGGSYAILTPTTTGAGAAVILRPDSVASTTGQFMVDTSGFSWNGQAGWHAGNLDPVKNGYIGTGDFNSYTTSGVYRFDTANPNGPGFGWGQVLVMHGAGDTVVQIAGSDGGDRLRWRGASGIGTTPVWSTWKDIHHSGNTSFDYLPLAGGIMKSAILFDDMADASWQILKNGRGGIWQSATGISLVGLNGGWKEFAIDNGGFKFLNASLNQSHTTDVNLHQTLSLADAAITDGTSISGISSGGSDYRSATINFRADGQWSGTSRGSLIQFRVTRPGTTALMEPLRIKHNRFLADFTTGASEVNGRMYFQTNVTDGVTNVSIIPNGINNTGIISVFGNSDHANSRGIQMGMQAGEAFIGTSNTGSTTPPDILFRHGGINRWRINTNNNYITSPEGTLVSTVDSLASAKRVLSVDIGGRAIWFQPRSIPGWNPLVANEDLAILFSKGASVPTSGNETLFIGGWSDGMYGMRIAAGGGSGTSIMAYAGLVGEQRGHYGLGQSGNRIWQIGIEADRSFKIWAYSDAGAYAYNPLTLYRSDSYNTLTITGGVTSIGSASTLRHYERDNNAYNWDIYAHAGNWKVWSNRSNADVMQVDGDGRFSARISVSSPEFYSNGWFRSNATGTGWYSQTHGGGIYMEDNSWVRTYGGKGFLISGADLRIESTSPTMVFYDNDAGLTSWIHNNGGQHGFLKNNSYEWCAYRDSSNNWACTGNIIAYASDVRLKRNFRPIEDALGKLAQIDGYFFDWDRDACNTAGFTPRLWSEHGLAAQQIQKIMPDIVVPSPSNKDYWTVMYERLTPFLIAVDKAQQRLIEAQGKEINDLRARLERLERMITRVA